MKKNQPVFNLPPWLRVDIILFLASIIVFLVYPKIDIWVTSHFYANETFYWNQNPLVRFIYLLFAKIHFVYLIAFVGLILYAIKTHKKRLKQQSIYLLACLVLGPGILVNIVLKDNSLGRPRPIHTEVFGGKHQFTPVFHYSGVCKKNCSFVSGHAAIGFFFMAFAWGLNRRYWLYIGIFSGLAIGFVRIIQGGHYLSDVLFSGWFNYFLYILINNFLGPFRVTKSPTTLS